MSSKSDRQAGAMLFVWADVDSNYEQDYNRWYDREHVSERVGIPGMLSATRYKAIDSGARRYLGLYRARNLDVFRSPTYQQLFQNQTAWSIANLGRMKNAVRRVGTLSTEGEGVGGWLVVARRGDAGAPDDLSTAQKLSRELASIEGVIGTNLLCPDIELSTPLPAEPSEGRILDQILLVGATQPNVATTVATAIRSAGFTGEVVTMSMLWHLDR